MSRVLYLVVGLVALTNVIESFIGIIEQESLFGLNVNIWIYRVFWSLISISIFYYDCRKTKANKVLNSEPK